MKRIFVSLAACAALLAGGWLALNLAFGQAKDNEKEKEKTYTLTASQLEEYVQKRVNQALATDKMTADQKILNPENWHTAIYKGVEYTVYTGPGQALATRWAKPAAEPKPPETPAEPKPAEPKPATPSSPAKVPSAKVPAAATKSS
jgi:hypothetical protein